MRGQCSIVRAVVACALALVAGCAQAGIAQAPNAGQRIKLVYFNARGAEPSECKLINRYQQDHPDIEIEDQASTAMSAPSDTDAISNLAFNVQAGIEVDISKVEVTHTPLAVLPAHAAIELTQSWDAWLWPMLIAPTRDMRTLQVGLAFINQTAVTWNITMAAVVLSVLSVVVPFFFAQDQFIAGIRAGAVKE